MDKWDNKERKSLLGNPFNIKLIIFLGIVVLAVSLLFGFIQAPAWATP